jgi:hypothetical protein
MCVIAGVTPAMHDANQVDCLHQNTALKTSLTVALQLILGACQHTTSTKQAAARGQQICWQAMQPVLLILLLLIGC